MAKNFEHVSHKKSGVIREVVAEEFYGLTPTENNSDANGSSPVKLNLAKRPTADSLILGEIAVNYKKGHETLSIKNSEDEIVGFVNENDFKQAQEIVAKGLAQEKNDRIESYSRFDSVMNELRSAVEENTKDLDDMELVISSSLNDLNDRIIETNGEIEKHIAESNEHFLEVEEVAAAALNDLNNRIENIGESVDNRFGEFDENIEKLELVISSSLNDLNSRINDITDNVYTKEEIDEATAPLFITAFRDFDAAEVQTAIEQGRNVYLSHDGFYMPLQEYIPGVNGSVSYLKFNQSYIDPEDGVETIEEYLWRDNEGWSGGTTALASTNNTYTKQEIDDTELVTATALNDLNDRLIAVNQDVANVNSKFDDMDSAIDDIELVVSSSFNDLNTRINDKTTEVNNLNDKIDTAVQTLRQDLEDVELVVSSSLNDLNTRIEQQNSVIASLLQRVSVLEQTT